MAEKPIFLFQLASVSRDDAGNWAVHGFTKSVWREVQRNHGLGKSPAAKSWIGLSQAEGGDVSLRMQIIAVDTPSGTDELVLHLPGYFDAGLFQTMNRVYLLTSGEDAAGDDAEGAADEVYDAAEAEYVDETAGTTHAPGRFFSGPLVVCAVVALGVLLAASAVLYRYDQKRLPRVFWGFESPRIFRDAKKVTAFLVKPEDVNVVQKPPYYDNLVMIGPLRYEQLKRIDISKDESIKDALDRVRVDLGDFHSYSAGEKSWAQPEWRFGLEFVDGNYTASILFDHECKIGRPQTVEKMISTEPMSADLLAFFQSIFPESKSMKAMTSKAVFSRPLVEAPPEPAPTATASGTAGSLNLTTTDADVLTLRGSTTTGSVSVPGPAGTAASSTTGTSTISPLVVPPAAGAASNTTPPTPAATTTTGTSTGPRIIGPAAPSDLTPTATPTTTTTTGPTTTTK
jgi:hypothetical protein